MGSEVLQLTILATVEPTMVLLRASICCFDRNILG